MNQNPSFFEKLTGAMKVPNPDQNAHVDDSFHLQKDYTAETKDIFVETEGKISMNPKKEEEEGQLTIDVYQTETEIVIKSPVAGVMPKDLDVTITNDMVTIKGRRDNEPIPKESYFFQELYWGPFSRSVILPTEIELEQAKAILKDGILTIRLPKVEKEAAKKLSIQVG